ncbi:hypothetical protein QA645_32170 [Bradyrhizobium sp. CIAT3101]|uniref:hypothetical protein n=1 Tax=Bradyrhizobium sp. CIAT3101 TaxID=439387 RepID=UPI0024B0FF53|nr:hypothetical protein [Bradyrhizobium sp. CIAT3101]WFU79153.1 hypothetical protein QA645_32170 [Bradyrhizobium sp. CIAT3101]
MSTGESSKLAQLLHEARLGFGNGIDFDLLKEARIAKGWISQRAVIEEYYRLVAAQLKEDQPPHPRALQRRDIMGWLASFMGRRAN